MLKVNKMKGRFSRSVVLALFILLFPTMVRDVRRFDFGIGTVKAPSLSVMGLKASALARGARVNTRVTEAKLE
jgi:hypothetical protein